MIVRRSFLRETKKQTGRRARGGAHATRQKDTHLPIGLGHTLELVFFLSGKEVGI